MAVGVESGDSVMAALGIVVPSLKRDRTRLVAALKLVAQGVARTLDSTC